MVDLTAVAGQASKTCSGMRHAADDRCRPITRVITPGQRHDAVAFEPLMRTIQICRRGRGPPRNRPGTVRADKAYSSRDTRSHLRRRRIRATIPERADQQAHRARARLLT